MGALPEDDRKLILDYYAYVKVEKVKHRKDMAKKLNLTPATLRKRVQRIREHLRRGIEEVLGKNVRRVKR
jgi:DNA-directed RNA polymerase specialized sigma24 family protein